MTGRAKFTTTVHLLEFENKKRNDLIIQRPIDSQLELRNANDSKFC